MATWDYFKVYAYKPNIQVGDKIRYKAKKSDHSEIVLARTDTKFYTNRSDKLYYRTNHIYDGYTIEYTWIKMI